MLTTDELTAIPLFSSLGTAQLADIARLAADIHVGAGEYVVHEGDEPALFIVLSGKIEVTKRVDGIERKIGERQPGKLLGEVPLIYGTQFQGGGRAAEPSRLLRLDARQYYAVAAAAPEVAARMNELARERIGGLQGIAAAARRAQVILLGQRWDTACLATGRNHLSLSVAPPPYRHGADCIRVRHNSCWGARC